MWPASPFWSVQIFQTLSVYAYSKDWKSSQFYKNFVFPQEQRNLVQDALRELEESKKLQEEDEDLEEDEKWSEAELILLAPAMGLIKTANAVLKRIQSSIKQNGNPYEFKSVKDMDDILLQCQKISPMVSFWYVSF